MAEKKTNRLKERMPYVLLSFALIGALLITIHIAQNIVDEGVFQRYQPELTETIVPANAEPTPTLFMVSPLE